MSGVRTALTIFISATTMLAAAPVVLAKSEAPAFDPAALTAALNQFTGQVEFSDRLQVNLSRSSRVVAPNKCQKEGEAELRELAASAASEEAYVFIPPLCVWVETGYNETERSVSLETAIVDRLVNIYSKVILYHIHTVSPEDTLWDFPAYADMLVVVLVNASYLDDPFVSVIHHAVTAGGTFNYSFVVSQETKQLIERMRATGLADFVPDNLAYEYARNVHRRKYYDSVSECVQRLPYSNRDLSTCFPMQAGVFVLTHRSHKP
jgi:hypothetical protein